LPNSQEFGLFSTSKFGSINRLEKSPLTVFFPAQYLGCVFFALAMLCSLENCH